MGENVLNVNLSLLFPALIIFIMLLLHCYFFRGARLAFTFFGSILALSFGREAIFYFSSNMSVNPPYQVIGMPFKIFNLPVVLYVGWAITFYLSWCLAEKILKRTGALSSMVFPTVTWSILIAGAISYCVEATAIRVGWWTWPLPDPRLKDFLVAPFSAFEGWCSETALFLLIFFLFECTKFRSQWWKVFLYPSVFFNIAISTIMYCIVFFSRNGSDTVNNINTFMMIFDGTRVLLPVILMFLWPISFKYERLDEKRSKSLFLYDAIPLSALFAILSVCIGIDVITLKEPYLIFSALPLIFLLLFSSKRIPAVLVFFSAFVALVIGNKLAYIISLPVAIFFSFLGLERLRDKYKLNIVKC